MVKTQTSCWYCCLVDFVWTSLLKTSATPNRCGIIGDECFVVSDPQLLKTLTVSNTTVKNYFRLTLPNTRNMKKLDSVRKT
jgi:hypothetical protein